MQSLSVGGVDGTTRNRFRGSPAAERVRAKTGTLESTITLAGYVAVDGRRPLVAEVQALVAGKDIPSPRRAVSGLDNARVAMLLAVLEKRAGVRLHDAEVYAATVGGMRVVEPAADLALALAITSARRDIALPSDVVVLGEIGLAGEVRRVTGVERRLAEAARLGFTHALVPPDSGTPPAGMRITEVRDVGVVLDRIR
jgi:DNA repair protein RadA/Sms